MSDAIKHECGLAFIRLRKPFSHYYKQYGTPFYGINKMYLLMEKQHNRGQDGAGFVSIKLNVEAGQPYMRRIRSNANQPIADIMQQIQTEIKGVEKHYPDLQKHPGMCTLAGTGNFKRDGHPQFLTRQGKGPRVLFPIG